MKHILLALTLSIAANDDAGETALPLNYVEYDPLLASAGQPTADQFQSLKERGFELIVNVAPPTVSRALPNEGYLVASTGMIYVNIPVDWERPTVRDFEIFAGVLQANRNLKTLVHCQVNMRATAFSYLYRVIYRGVDPREAFASMAPIWTPNETWTELARTILEAHGMPADLWPTD